MKLDALARGDAERVVAVLRGEIIKHAPLLRGHHATGDAPPDHHDVFLAGLAQIAVVLLIGTVKLEELIVVIGEMILPARDGRGDGTPKVGIAVLISSLCVGFFTTSVVVIKLQ